jgi:hypothetical protein
MRIFLIRIALITVLSITGGILSIVHGNWGLGTYLISWTVIACYHEIRILLNNDDVYIDYRIKYPDRKIQSSYL